MGTNFPETAAPAAFTLIELLVVIAIIGLLAVIGLPAIKDFGKGNTTRAATRQLLDDVASARRRAIANRSDVYMVFAPPSLAQQLSTKWGALSEEQRRLATNILNGQLTSYALFAKRQVGDQPGHPTERYLTEWKTLPRGTFIPESKFLYRTNGLPRFAYPPPDDRFRFPFPVEGGPRLDLPYIAFDYRGRLFRLAGDGVTRIEGSDEVLPLARGSILYPRDAQGRAEFTRVDVLENPPGNSVNQSNHVRIDWLTGRARVERQEVE